jgi:hypothetical protein
MRITLKQDRYNIFAEDGGGKIDLRNEHSKMPGPSPKKYQK